VRIGFKTGGLAVVSAEMGMIGYDDTRAKTFFDRAVARIKEMPGVENVAIAERLPFSINYNRNNVFLPDRQGPDDRGLVLDMARVAPEYFETLGIPIVEGRNFIASDTVDAPKVAIVNETMARKYWPGKSALGQRFRTRTYNGPEYTIVGISADYKVSTIGEAPTPYVHYAVSQQPNSGEEIVARTHGDAGVLLTAIRRELTAMEPNIVFLDSQTMDAQVDATLLPARFGAVGVAAVGVVAMALAAIGLYGVIAYAVSRRTREIGIRMALGAHPASVLALVMKQGLTVAAGGIAVGAMLALGAAKAVSGALYDVSFVDPIAWGSACAVLLAVSALANAIPARRASRVNPSLALRSE